MYSFLFDRRSLALLVSGTAAAGVLLFAAGVLVGLRINLPAAPARTAEFKALSTFEGSLIGTANADPASVPAAPRLSAPAVTEPGPPSGDPAPAARTLAPAPAATPVVADSETAAPGPTAPIEVPTAPPPAPARPAPDPVASVEPVPASTKAPVRPAATAEVVEGRTAPASASAAPHGPYVQVGAFGVAENAEKVLALLLSEGFNGYIAEQRTRSGGMLHVVCFGRYPTLKAAFMDAQKYLAGGAEREAVVRSPS